MVLHANSASQLSYAREVVRPGVVDYDYAGSNDV